MKKITLLAIAALAFSFTNAQTVKFGVKAGLNVSNLTYSNDYVGIANTPTTSAKIGFHVGGLVELKLTDKFAIQPELLFSMQGATTKLNENDSQGFSSTSEDKINLSYLNVPVMFKYYIVKGFNVEAGPQVGFLVSAKDKLTYNENDNGTVFNSSTSVDVKSLYKSIDFGFNLGAGYDFTENFFAGIRYNIGLSDVAQAGTVKYQGQDIPTLKYYKEKNNVLSVSVGYKF